MITENFGIEYEPMKTTLRFDETRYTWQGYFDGAKIELCHSALSLLGLDPKFNYELEFARVPISEQAVTVSHDGYQWHWLSKDQVFASWLNEHYTNFIGGIDGILTFLANGRSEMLIWFKFTRGALVLSGESVVINMEPNEAI